MKLTVRVRRLMSALARHESSGPHTIVLVEATSGQPLGSRDIWNGAAREIVFDPREGPPMLPSGSYKLVLGPVFDV